MAATSRLLDKPLGLVIQSSSAAGKSTLADAVLAFMPPEETFSCSAMTSYQLLFDGRGYEGQPTACGLVDPSTLREPASNAKGDS